MHAIIRSEGETLHFIGDPDGYNLQTLHMHARGLSRDDRAARIEIALDELDAQLWERHAPDWLARMARLGIPVLVWTDTAGAKGKKLRVPIARRGHGAPIASHRPG